MIHSPTYGNDQWGDLLTAYDGNGLQYDAIGNLTSDGAWTYTWEHGRQLASMTGNGTTWSYTYDADGMRTGRTNNSTTYSYIYNGGQLTQMTVGSNTLSFTYDATGNPQTVTYDNTTYYYAVNLQGDVVAILNGSGNAVVSYAYDAWGNVLSTTGELASTLGALNPLRYRGYVYDQETQLYYLQSRYYNPEIGRFLNADALISTGQGLLGNNMFAYCNNNPVSHADPSGRNWEFVYYWEYTIYEVKTEAVSEENGDKVYRTTITYSAALRSYFGCLAEETTYIYEVPFEFIVTNDGVILYDNQQLASAYLGAAPVRDALAREMLFITQSQNEDALQARTVVGISQELALHYYFYENNILYDNAKIANIGGMGNIGYDSNAWFYELFFGWVEHIF